MAGRTQPGRKEARRRRGRDFSKTRWLYQKDGRDLGPFQPPEIKDLLRKGEITADTRVRESASRDWHKVREVKVFVAYLKELQLEAEQRARESELDRAEHAVRNKRRLPYMMMTLGILTVLGVGGWYGWQLWEDRGGIGSSRITSGMYRNLELPELTVRAYLDTSGPMKWSKEQIKVRKAKADPKKKAARRAGSKATSPRTANTGSSADLAPAAQGEHNMAFDKEPVGREFDFSDTHRIRTKALPRLESCATAEANRNGGFPGTTVRVKVAPSGKISVSAGTNGRRSKSFMACARGSVRGLSVKPFDGTARSIDFKLTVRR